MFLFIAPGSVAENVGLLEHASNVPQSALKSRGRATVSTMADLEEAVTAGVAANAFIVAEATADEFKRSFVQAIEFASLAMMRGRAEKRSRPVRGL